MTIVKNKSCHHEPTGDKPAILNVCRLNCRMAIESLKAPNKSRDDTFGSWGESNGGTGASKRAKVIEVFSKMGIFDWVSGWFA